MSNWQDILLSNNTVSQITVNPDDGNQIALSSESPVILPLTTVTVNHGVVTTSTVFITLALDNVFSTYNGGRIPWLSWDNGGVSAGISLAWCSNDSIYSVKSRNDIYHWGTSYRLDLGTFASWSNGMHPSGGLTKYYSNLLAKAWIKAARVEGSDHIYAAFSDQGVPGGDLGQTASIRFSLDGGRSWKNSVIENKSPKWKDSSSVRVAVNGRIVYGLFERYNGLAGDGINAIGDVIIVRDDDGGKNGFNDLSGARVVKNQVFPLGKLGRQKLGADFSLAIDPNDAGQVYVAYAVQTANDPRVSVLGSHDLGVTWQQLELLPANTAMPAIAVTENGVVGIVYTKFVAGNLETHFSYTGDGFVSLSDETLSCFKDGSITFPSPSYIGDHNDLVVVKNTFYGAFSSSDDASLFPVAPKFSSLPGLPGKLGKSVPYAVIPYFFKATVDNFQYFNGN